MQRYDAISMESVARINFYILTLLVFLGIICLKLCMYNKYRP